MSQNLHPKQPSSTEVLLIGPPRGAHHYTMPHLAMSRQLISVDVNPFSTMGGARRPGSGFSVKQLQAAESEAPLSLRPGSSMRRLQMFYARRSSAPQPSAEPLPPPQRRRPTAYSAGSRLSLNLSRPTVEPSPYAPHIIRVTSLRPAGPKAVVVTRKPEQLSAPRERRGVAQARYGVPELQFSVKLEDVADSRTIRKCQEWINTLPEKFSHVVNLASPLTNSMQSLHAAEVAKVES